MYGKTEIGFKSVFYERVLMMLIIFRQNRNILDSCLFVLAQAWAIPMFACVSTMCAIVGNNR